MKLFRNTRYSQTSNHLEPRPNMINPVRPLHLLLTALVMGGWVSADDVRPPEPEPTPTPRTFGNGVLPEHLAVYDVNDDGRLSVEEGQALRQDRNTGGRLATFRSKWDTNNDGTISPAEREAAKTAIRRIITERRCRRFEEVDSNADDFLSLAEFNAIGAVQAVDTNTPGTADSLFLHLDKDGDNKVSKDEFLRSLDAAPPQAAGVTPAPPHPQGNTPTSP